MDSSQEPLGRLVEALQWFAVCKELRLLHVLTDSDLRVIVLEHIAGAEHDKLNSSPFFVLEAPVERDNDGWDIRTLELRDDWDELRQLLQDETPSTELPELPASSSWSTSFGRFGAVLGAAQAQTSSEELRRSVNIGHPFSARFRVVAAGPFGPHARGPGVDM